jgi:DNA-binding response OmpR family regulator
MKKVGRILIVDPDPAAVQDYTSMMVSEGHTVVACATIPEAIEVAEKDDFDSLIMDIELVDVNGFDTLDLIRSSNPHAEVILTAKENTLEQEAWARAQDIFYYHIKSFQKEELLAAVNSIFEKTEKEDKKMKNGPAKILVIDDDPDYLKSIQLILESASFEFISAENPEEGMKKVKSEEPDLILLDIMMDSLFDGFSMCHTLKTSKEYRAYRHIPVIFISAVKKIAGTRFTFSGSDHGMAGPDDYIDKPVDPEDLLNRIREQLEKTA